MIAQAVVESGWGSSALSQARIIILFGIKGSYQGQTVYMDTLEYLNNQWVTKKEPFRQYPSLRSHSVITPMFYVILHLAMAIIMQVLGKAIRNPIQMQQLTLTGRYATDPSYAGKIEQYHFNLRLNKI